MGETTVEEAAAKSKPKIVVPSRGSMESLFCNGLAGIGFSPGPMSLVSSFFSDQGPFSFSQLLAGTIASPIAAAKPAYLLGGEEKSRGDSSEDGKNSDGGGFRRNRPVTLVVAPPQLQLESLSSLFMVPPGLSPSGMLNSHGFLSPLQSPFGMSHQQALAHVTAQAAFSQSYMQMQSDLQLSSSETVVSQSSQPPSKVRPVPAQLECTKTEPSEISQSERKPAYNSGDKPESDGYNWRKYGQKHVKASECPRSYYKCTYLNCIVKKKVERTCDGRVSEIVYKGEHNHSPPQTNKRKKDASSFAAQPQSEGKSVEENVHEFQNDVNEGHVIVIEDENDGEPIAKRRSLEKGQSVVTSSHQTITESKIVVQTRSEVDLLDDGYKWRKYGQKVVKGNPYPRSYYKCTYVGCNVRKHVERSSADPKTVITSYEGKHSHEIPAGKYSSSNPGVKKITARVLPISLGMKFADDVPITLQLKEEEIVV